MQDAADFSEDSDGAFSSSRSGHDSSTRSARAQRQRVRELIARKKQQQAMRTGRSSSELGRLSGNNNGSSGGGGGGGDVMQQVRTQQRQARQSLQRQLQMQKMQQRQDEVEQRKQRRLDAIADDPDDRFSVDDSDDDEDDDDAAEQRLAFLQRQLSQGPAVLSGSEQEEDVPQPRALGSRHGSRHEDVTQASSTSLARLFASRDNLFLDSDDRREQQQHQQQQQQQQSRLMSDKPKPNRATAAWPSQRSSAKQFATKEERELEELEREMESITQSMASGRMLNNNDGNDNNATMGLTDLANDDLLFDDDLEQEEEAAAADTGHYMSSSNPDLAQYLPEPRDDDDDDMNNDGLNIRVEDADVYVDDDDEPEEAEIKDQDGNDGSDRETQWRSRMAAIRSRPIYRQNERRRRFQEEEEEEQATEEQHEEELPEERVDREVNAAHIAAVRRYRGYHGHDDEDDEDGDVYGAYARGNGSNQHDDSDDDDNYESRFLSTNDEQRRKNSRRMTNRTQQEYLRQREEQLTFKPEINRMPSMYQRTQRYDGEQGSFYKRQMMWYHKKSLNAAKRLAETERSKTDECTFEPKLADTPVTKSSKLLALDGPTRRRLLQQRSQARKRLVELQIKRDREAAELAECTFQPQISSKSRRIGESTVKRALREGRIPEPKKKVNKDLGKDYTFKPKTNKVKKRWNSAQYYLEQDAFERLSRAKKPATPITTAQRRHEPHPDTILDDDDDRRRRGNSDYFDQQYDADSDLLGAFEYDEFMVTDPSSAHYGSPSRAKASFAATPQAARRGGRQNGRYQQQVRRSQSHRYRQRQQGYLGDDDAEQYFDDNGDDIVLDDDGLEVEHLYDDDEQERRRRYQMQLRRQQQQRRDRSRSGSNNSSRKNKKGEGSGHHRTRSKKLDSFLERQERKERERREKIEQLKREEEQEMHRPLLSAKSLEIAERTGSSFLDRQERMAARKAARLQNQVGYVDEEMTFSPRINPKSKKRAPRSIDDMSMGDRLRKEAKVQEKRMDLRRREMEQATFRPQMNSKDRIRRKVKSGLMLNEDQHAYIERLRHKAMMQEKERERIRRQREEAEIQDCTFQPEVRDAPQFVKRIAESMRLSRQLRHDEEGDKEEERPDWR